MTGTVLVTGGAGYVGSHACKALARSGYTPVCYDNLVFGHEWAVRWGPFEQGDILDRERLDTVLARYRPEAVLHFAGFAYVGESVTDPARYYRNNVAGSLALLDAMRDHGIPRIVFSSSCSTYGLPEVVPIPESHPQRPVNPYGHSKLVVEQMMRDFEAAHGLRFASLRYFNAAGADPDAEIGEDHEPETHLIPLLLQAALGRRPGVSIYGTDYATPDGTCIRDYVHVADLGDAHVRALARLEAGNPSTCLNLGTGKGSSVLGVVKAARRITGREIPVTEAPRRAGDPPELVADARRAYQELGWNPRYPDIETQILHAWEWLRRNR